MIKFTLLENGHTTCRLLEQKWPVVVASLALYNVLKSMNYWPAEYDDAEQLTTWYSELVLLGQSPRPSEPRIAHHCLDRFIHQVPRRNFSPYRSSESRWERAFDAATSRAAALSIGTSPTTRRRNQGCRTPRTSLGCVLSKVSSPSTISAVRTLTF